MNHAYGRFSGLFVACKSEERPFPSAAEAGHVGSHDKQVVLRHSVATIRQKRLRIQQERARSILEAANRVALVYQFHMPRANRYFVPATTYHLTHRCHDRKFLLRFAVDRDTYRQVLWETKPRGAVWVLAYCLTSNHMHLLVRAEEETGISSWMQRAQGEFAQWYNRRKGRSGAFWEGRYHCTLIGGSEHCEHCMTYIELNMVRAGVVQHPRDWGWCSYQEWMGRRQRYRLLDIGRALDHFGGVELDRFREHYERRIRERQERGSMARESCWTESVAVGNKAFVEQVESQVRWRRRFKRDETSPGVWALREGWGTSLTGEDRG